jgi:WD40 repeat protein
MVKEIKIKEMVYGKLGGLLEIAFRKYGFKYLKSKKCFLRQDGIFCQQVNLNYPDPALSYNEELEEIYLDFYLYPEIKIPDFEKWHLEMTGEEAHFSHHNKSFGAYLKLSFDDFGQDDFYTPTKSQEFKRFVSLSLFKASKENRADLLEIGELIEKEFGFINSEFIEKSDILKLFECREYPLASLYVPLLTFGGFNVLAKDYQDKVYHYYVDKIGELLDSNDEYSGRYISIFGEFIQTSEKVLNTKYDNPFERKVKAVQIKNDGFDFSEKLKFKEITRLDVSTFDVRSCHINPKGDIFLFIEDKKIVQLNQKGETLFEKEIEPGKGFEPFFNVKTGLLPESGGYYANNFVVRNDGTVMELPLNMETKKSKKQINPHITDIAYSKSKKKYHLIYTNKFISYSADGKFEAEIIIEHGWPERIIVEKEWIVIQERDKAILICDFGGKLIHRFDYGNGNNNFEFSKSFEYLVCFFYSTKSQFYQLSNQQQKTLWAHPTYIKNYKELMYHDIHHNFGMDQAKFSPDGKYLVGGAEHGKYVAWKLPKLERIELIPQQELLNLMTYSNTVFSEQGTKEIITKPELVELENQTFLKNRGNGISNIFFYDHGDIFLTELGYGNYLLSWNRNFENLKFYKVDGRIEFHGDKYLTQRNKNEIIIYERITKQ